MKINPHKKILSIYKQINPNNYASLKPKLIEISKCLETGIVDKNLEQYFENDFLSESFELSMMSSFLRESYIKKFGYFLITENFLSNCFDILNKDLILDIGAGSGFLSSKLSEYNLNIKAIDLFDISSNKYGFETNYINVLNTDGVKYIEKNEYDTILLSWPNYDNDFAFNILTNMKSNKQLLYIGESKGGCTANDDFFDLLSSKAVLLESETKKLQNCSLSWFGIHDKPYLYKII